MSNKLSIPYFRIPRTLTSHPAVIDAPIAQRWVLVMLVEGAAYLPCEFCDHGKMMKVEPGQVVITRRGFADYANVEENDVRRALDRFEKVGILTHKVTHKKTVVTITHSDTYNLIKQYSDPRSDPRVTQDLQKSDPEKENLATDKEIKTKKIQKEKIKIREWVSLSQDEIDKHFHEYGDQIANQMIDKLDSYNASRQKHYISDAGALKKGGWVHEAVLKSNAPKSPYNAKSVDRRTCDINGLPVENQYAGRF